MIWSRNVRSLHVSAYVREKNSVEPYMEPSSVSIHPFHVMDIIYSQCLSSNQGSYKCTDEIHKMERMNDYSLTAVQRKDLQRYCLFVL